MTRNPNKKKTLPARFVVDASGPAHVAKKWTEHYKPVEEHTYDPLVQYTCFRCDLKPGEKIDTSPGNNFSIAFPDPLENQHHGNIIFQYKPGKWMIMCAMIGTKDAKSPRTDEEVQEFMEKSPNPKEAVERYSKLIRTGPFEVVNAGLSRYLPYKSENVPVGLAVVGDAYCKFNPIFGQGQTTSLVSIVTLHRCLLDANGNLEQVRKTYFPLVASRLQVPWLLNRAIDYDYKAIEKMPSDKGNVLVPLFGWFVKSWRKAAHYNDFASRAWVRTIGMVEPPFTPMNPRLLWAIFLANVYYK